MKKNSKTIITALSFIIIILLALFIGDISDNFNALMRILESPGILLSDSIAINRDYNGILNGFVLNLFLTVGLSLIFIKIANAPFEGAVIAGVFTVAGFTFIGKNAFNVLPIFIGVILFSKFKKAELKTFIPALLFGTGIAPISSYIIFGAALSHIPLAIRFPSAIAAGIVIGFLIPVIAPQALKFHGGFNLYNIGFTMGLLAVAAHGILRTAGIHVQSVGVPLEEYPDYTWPLMLSLTALSISLIILAFILDKNVVHKYKLILKQTGQLAANFSESAGQSAVILNMGVMGLVALIVTIPILIIADIPLLAILVAGILTIIGFAAFGKHPVNALPIMAGAMIAFLIIRAIDSPFTSLIPTNHPDGPYLSPLNIHAYTCAILFATCLAPISKEYGWKAGIITGFFHMTIIILGGNFQGGFNLYNNGWVAGLVGGTLVPIFHTFRRDPKKRKKRGELDTKLS